MTFRRKLPPLPDPSPTGQTRILRVEHMEEIAERRRNEHLSRATFAGMLHEAGLEYITITRLYKAEREPDWADRVCTWEFYEIAMEVLQRVRRNYES